jgi:hypothetical protein
MPQAETKTHVSLCMHHNMRFQFCSSNDSARTSQSKCTFHTNNTRTWTLSLHERSQRLRSKYYCIATSWSTLASKEAEFKGKEKNGLHMASTYNECRLRSTWWRGWQEDESITFIPLILELTVRSISSACQVFISFIAICKRCMLSFWFKSMTRACTVRSQGL